jgi:radical SAM enzyme (TIGR01210 family)
LYPPDAAGRDRFVLARRPSRPDHDPWRHQGVLLEEERSERGDVVRSATIFLTGRECPWRCVMCDLWKHTLAVDTPRGALARQIDGARGEMGAPLPSQVKLYNAGSFFDPRAVPEDDYGDLADAVGGFGRVIVESHPRLVGPRLRRWRDALARAAGDGLVPAVEVAMGLETAHPAALHRMHKRFTIDDFARAAERIRLEDATLRVFLLVGVPFVRRDEQLEWLQRSVACAFACGASVISLIPTRGGNGALEALAGEGWFQPVTIEDLESAFDAVLPGSRGRVFVDTWDLHLFSRCTACIERRRQRLTAMNLTQRELPRVACEACSAGGRAR